MTDLNKSVEFAQRVGQSIGGFMEVIMASMGDRLGLFKDLAANPSSTAEQVAERKKLDKRYVLEWLNGMVASQYISYDAGAKTYSIPPENIPVLAKEFSPVSMGGMLSMVEMVMPAFPRVLDSFSKGGGVAFNEYSPEFFQSMDRHTGCKFENDLLTEWMNLLDPKVKQLLEKGVRVCDVGCGRGRALRKLAKAFPKSTFTGYDVYRPSLDAAEELAKKEGISNLSFTQIGNRMSCLPPDGELFDIIFVFDVVHDSADPVALLKCIRSSIKPDGIFVCLDIKCSDNASENPTFAYGISLLYCMTTSLQQGGVGLGTCGLTERVMNELCTKAGFSAVRRIDITSPFNVLWEVRP